MLKHPVDISDGSMKLVTCICDYCGVEFSLPNRNRIKGYKIIKKDACKNCRSKKRQESCLLKYGTKTPSESPEIREKTSKSKGGSGIVVEKYKQQILDLYNSDKNISVSFILIL